MSNSPIVLDLYGEGYLELVVNKDYSALPGERQIAFVVSYFAEAGFIFMPMDAEDSDEDFYLIGCRHMELFVDRKHWLLSNVHIFRALGDETRQNLIRRLSQKRYRAEDLAREMSLTISTISYHLQILELEGFIRKYKSDGREYFLLDEIGLKKIVERALTRIIESSKA